jgi:hypothetical protein
MENIKECSEDGKEEHILKVNIGGNSKTKRWLGKADEYGAVPEFMELLEELDQIHKMAMDYGKKQKVGQFFKDAGDW